jgi:hypothetical protein
MSTLSRHAHTSQRRSRSLARRIVTRHLRLRDCESIYDIVHRHPKAFDELLRSVGAAVGDRATTKTVAHLEHQLRAGLVPELQSTLSRYSDVRSEEVGHFLEAAFLLRVVVGNAPCQQTSARLVTQP